jgi:hypothetical protein
MGRRRQWLAYALSIAGLGVLFVCFDFVATPARAYTQQCASALSGERDSANPLGTPGLVGSDPLTRAHLFVDNPWLFGGDAANAIAREVGLGALAQQWRGVATPWAEFKSRVNALHLSAAVRFRVRQLEKIGDYPEAHQFSLYTADGSGPGVYTQVQNYVCRIQRTDPQAAAVITTYFLSHRGCASWQPKFKAEVDGLRAAVGNFPAVIFVEEDALDTICDSWHNAAAVRDRTMALRYEIDRLSTLPHALLYVEGGTVDATHPDQVARVLRGAHIAKIRGFFVGDTHFNWAYREIHYSNEVAKLIGTRADGNGPIPNPDPYHQGNEELCNPPHRGLGPKPGASNGRAYGLYSPYLDGFVWVTTPGESAATTCRGRRGHWAQSGIFDENLAVDYAAHAANRVGPQPRFPRLPPY